MTTRAQDPSRRRYHRGLTSEEADRFQGLGHRFSDRRDLLELAARFTGVDRLPDIPHPEPGPVNAGQ
ncbi:hypothetical protein ABZW10_04165 [Kitasatospora sp. NPDC004723]|uniref:hypothetical protein n=1 Tax=Kitasatospora sp. NPDC004723 TaxID=3154288 RepID=UPI0033B72EDF